MEAYTFNAKGCTSNKSTVNELFAAFCKRMRDDVGKKFQVVCFRNLADYKGAVRVRNTIAGQTDDPSLVPWVTGVVAGTSVNKSATNMNYDGEYAVDTGYTQAELEAGILEGSFMFHFINRNAGVTEDINTFIACKDEKNCFMSLTEFESKWEVNITEVPILGMDFFLRLRYNERNISRGASRRSGIYCIL